MGCIVAKLFVGLNFRDAGLLSRKITGFRQRFDPKYRNYSFPHMSLLAPFEVLDDEVENLQETLKEEMETFFYGSTESITLGVTGVDVLQHKRKFILNLNPKLGVNLQYCSEIVKDICKSYVPQNIRYKENKKQFIPLGVFKTSEELNIVMESAGDEFKNSSDIEIESISLYQKKYGVWVEREILITFEQKTNEFLHSKVFSL